ncbi:MAG: hypothetical protein P8P30_04375 [Rickettsiales bacterium]|nr:hypothetical protein [Rickettsiales bacterium]
MANPPTSFLSGAFRGAWKGALIGGTILGTLGLIAATGGFGLAAAPAFAGATNVITVGLISLVNFFAPIFTGVGALVVGGSALIGGVHQGVRGSVEQTHIQNEKADMIELAQTARQLEKQKTPQRSQDRADYVPQKVPNVAKGEMPKSWEKTVTEGRERSKQQAPVKSQDHADYVPQKAPNAAKGEMSESWGEAVTEGRERSKQQAPAGHSH